MMHNITVRILRKDHVYDARALYQNENHYVVCIRIMPKRLFPYGIYVVLIVRDGTVPWAPREHICMYVAAAKKTK